VRAAPGDAEARLLLARAAAARGRPAEAIAAGLRALALAPGRADAVALLSALLAGRRLEGLTLEPDEVRAVTAALRHPEADPQAFAGLAAGHLTARDPFGHAARLAAGAGAGAGGDAAAAWLLSPKGRRALADPLLAALLERAINTDPQLEAVLTAARRRLLEAAADAAQGADGAAALWHRREVAGFAAALAHQALSNEFVFAETPEETARVGAVADALARRARPGRGDEPVVLAWGLYRPLDRLPVADALLAARAAFSPAVAALIDRAVGERREEARLGEAVPDLLPARDAVSVRVRDQYEENPYPRWTRLRLPRPGGWRDGLAPFFAADELAALGPAPRVLVAGCGTGRQAIAAAVRYGPEAEVLAVDLSRASLGFAVRMARHHGVGNLRFARADLLDLPALGRRFDVIECSGVLHHLGDPAAGLRALVACLAPGGAMRLALYSARARRHVGAVRAELAADGLPTTPEAIRAARQALLASDGAPARAVVATFRDVFSLSGCRDLLFHVQEHRFDPPGLAALLAGAGLDFRGFVLAPETAAAFARRFPEPARRRDLSAWADFEARHPDTFAGMYDVWCRGPA